MNKIVLAGLVTEEPIFSHEVHGEKFYRFRLLSSRQSGNCDILMCTVPEIIKNGINEGNMVKVLGEIRTRNVHEDDKNHLEVTVFVKEVLPYEEDENNVELYGFICKEPTYRVTPFGRQITDLMVASNREYFKSDYIPCIAWGRNAIRASEFNVGTRVKVLGRLQSREYKKKIDDETYEVRTAYELSAYMIDVVEESEETDESSN